MYEEVSPFHQHRWSNEEAMIQPSQDADRKPPHAEETAGGVMKIRVLL